ncbi:MAG: hypothetical protein MJK18_11940 [Bdellovibrionales bacterium]|nr:hypothetical protein [Bdellovibrionales bacterium]
MKFLAFLLILFLAFPVFAERKVARDIKELHMMDTFTCTSNQMVQYKLGRQSFQRGKKFRIPVDPGGYVKLQSQKYNFLFEANFAEGVHYSLKQISALKPFPYKMKKTTDKKTYVNVVIREGKKKPVFTMNCKRR